MLMYLFIVYYAHKMFYNFFAMATRQIVIVVPYVKLLNVSSIMHAPSIIGNKMNTPAIIGKR